jgi:anti-sigma B factor antagonist
MSLEITVAPRDNKRAVVSLAGRLDLLSAQQVKQALAETVAKGHERLVVDLSSVAFIDSSGLGALVSGLKSARIAGGDLRIAQPDKQARYILEVSTLDRILHPYASVEEAFSGY